MPTTRARRPASNRKERTPEAGPSTHISAEAVEEHFKQAQAGLRSLTDQLRSLSEENERLKHELETARIQPTSSERRSGKSRNNSEDQTHLVERIRILETTVNDLKTDNLKQKRKIEKFKKKELQKELKELGQSTTFNDGTGKDGDIDSTYRMRKLLRKFSDLMIVTTLGGEDDECPVCLEPLRLKECSALECQHILCHVCLPKMSKGADETVTCAVCRKSTPRDEIELVHMSERDRWDQLLEIAQAWDRFDVRGEAESSEEEAEEEFIDDNRETSEKTEISEADEESESSPAKDATSEKEDVEEQLSLTPSPPPRRGFAQSPVKEKRKMMEQLAEQKRLKRRR
ncbi:hypothetical protein CVT26_009482 [Gymnopilus dilepis]|uniref:RING-type domain-containing protein n=1 Tax=Gymnopilus dilepis TaxID=231916 RepID=A0A409VJY5_9AGAR|nr:hypothetical protein CVT26_009482 [Gymnopilus dilepis]